MWDQWQDKWIWNMSRNTLRNLFGVKHGREVKRYSYVDVRRSGSVFANIFEEEFWFCEVEVLGIDEFRVRIRNSGAWAHFEEAVDDEDECREMAGNSSATFRTLSTVCWTAFPTDFWVERHRLRNCWRPSNKFDLKLTTTASSYWWSAIWWTPLRDQVWLKEVNKFNLGIEMTESLPKIIIF